MPRVYHSAPRAAALGLAALLGLAGAAGAAAARSASSDGLTLRKLRSEGKSEVAVQCYPWQIPLDTPCECERPASLGCTCIVGGGQSCLLGSGLGDSITSFANDNPELVDRAATQLMQSIL